MNEIRNTIKVETDDAADQKDQSVSKEDSNQAKRKSKTGFFKSLMEGSFLVRERAIKLLPFLIYLTLFGLLYIFNSNYANRTIISISKTKKQIEEQRFEYINTKSKLMQTTRQTEIAKKLLSTGLKESKIPPRKIVIEK